MLKNATFIFLSSNHQAAMIKMISADNNAAMINSGFSGHSWHSSFNRKYPLWSIPSTEFSLEIGRLHKPHLGPPVNEA
jgi:hypothetical protein